MKITHTFLALALIALVSCLGAAQVGYIDGVYLTTRDAPWTLRSLGNDLDITRAEAKPDNRSAYFLMRSASSGLTVSLFIQPVDKCKTGVECRDSVLNVGNPAWGNFEGLSKGTINDFSYFEFYRSEVRGQPVKMLDMYAESVSQGYWLDLHMSKVLYKPADHALFEKVANSIVLVPKTGAPNGPFDKQLAKGQAVASQWFTYWDSLKCRESFSAMSSLTRAKITELSWVDYCMRTNKKLATNRSRRLIAAAFTAGLPPKTDRPLAIFAYQSDFADRSSVTEILGLLLERDGTWTVTNYLPQ